EERGEDGQERKASSHGTEVGNCGAFAAAHPVSSVKPVIDKWFDPNPAVKATIHACLARWFTGGTVDGPLAGRVRFAAIQHAVRGMPRLDPAIRFVAAGKTCAPAGSDAFSTSSNATSWSCPIGYHDGGVPQAKGAVFTAGSRQTMSVVSAPP